MDIRGGTPDDWIVCGWFTDDPVYKAFAEQLAASLDRVGAPHDLACVQGDARGWEANTLQKPAHMLAAIDRHPGRTIIFMDVDFTATGDLSWLAYGYARADISLQIRVRRQRSGSTQLNVSSQVIVLRPTPLAREFVASWCQNSRASRVYGDTDEATLKLTLGTLGGWTITRLDQHRLYACLTHHKANLRGRRILGPIREMVNLLRPAWLAPAS
ncbi:MAG: hypothetical protein J2P50_14045 [Hyphomicrobiaceae bacterium]|nr:hypothetical protein [Hyphomicrobiaceae bacterium]